MKLFNRIITLILIVLIACTSAVFADANGNYTEYEIIEISEAEALAAEADEIFRAIVGRDFGGNTRGAFISDVVSLLKLGSEKPDSPDFKDVQPGRGDAGYIRSALEAGLISEGASFRPDDEITLGEAATIAVHALGSGELAENKGGWPAGYIRCAKDAKLLEGVVGTDELSADDAKILILNMLNASLTDATYSSDSRRYTVGEKTFLESYYGISLWSGVVTETPAGGIYSDAEKSDTPRLTAGERTFRIKDSKKIYSDLLGYYSNIYYDEDGYLIAAASDCTNKTVSISGECADVEGNLRFLCRGERKTTSYKLDEGYSVIYNGSKSDRGLKDMLVGINGRVELIDNDGDNTYEIVSVRNSFFVTVSSVSKSGRVVYDKNTSANMIDLSDEDGNYSLKSKNEEIWITSLKAGDTLEVYRSESLETVEAYLLDVSVSGKIDAATDDALTIDGVEYRMTDYFRAYYLDVIKPGNSGSFTLSSMGELVNYSDYSASLSYGYVTGIIKENPMSDTVQIRIFTADGKQEIFTLNEKVRLDGKGVKATAVYDVLTDGGEVKDQLVTYSVDDDNMLTAIDLAETASADDFGNASDPMNSLKEYLFNQKTFYYKSGANVMHPCFNVSSTTVFVIPNDLSDTQIYRATDSSYFKDCDTYSLKVYDVNESGCAKVVVYRTDEISPRISEYAPSFVIEEMSVALDSEGEVRHKVYGWQAKKYTSYFLDDSISIYKKSGEKLGFGDIIRFYAENGSIKALVCDFDANENVFDRNNSSDAAQFNVGNLSVNYQAGRVYSLGGGFMFMTNSDTGADDFSLENLRNFTFNTDNIAIINLTEKTVKTGKAEDIRTYKNAGDYADFVLLRQRQLVTSGCFVYVR